MSIILDANIIKRVLIDIDPDLADLSKSIFGERNPDITMIYGGSKLDREYSRISGLISLIAALDRAGKAKSSSNRDVDVETKYVTDELNCLSDDEHIIALARVNGARLLCSHDKDLHSDFTNPEILSPRGYVYQDSKHNHLIRQHS